MNGMFTDLIHLPKDGILTDGDRAFIMYMNKKILENYIKEHHHNEIITEHIGKYDYVKTRVKEAKGGYIRAKDLDSLYEKLYSHYSGADLSNSATIMSLFSDALDWHTEKKGNTEKTKNRSRYTYKKYIQGTDFEKKLLKDIKASDIEAFFISFKDKLTKKRICDVKSIINWIFEYATIKDIIPYNIAIGISVSGIKAVPGRRVGDLAYTREEAELIVSYLINSRNLYDEAICFNFLVGLRYSELSDLKWEDIDWNHRILVVTHANTESGNIKNGEKGVKMIPLSEDAIWLLQKCHAERPDSVYVMPNKVGNRISNNRLNERLGKACRAVGVKYRSNHKIRAYYITGIAYHSDANRARILGGQSDIRTTEIYLSKLITQKDRDAVEKVCDFGIRTHLDQPEAKEKTS